MILSRYRELLKVPPVSDTSVALDMTRRTWNDVPALCFIARCLIALRRISISNYTIRGGEGGEKKYESVPASLLSGFFRSLLRGAYIRESEERRG